MKMKGKILFVYNKLYGIPKGVLYHAAGEVLYKSPITNLIADVSSLNGYRGNERIKKGLNELKEVFILDETIPHYKVDTTVAKLVNKYFNKLTNTDTIKNGTLVFTKDGTIGVVSSMQRNLGAIVYYKVNTPNDIVRYEKNDLIKLTL